MDPRYERRLPWVALALSLLSIGVGHIYSGRIAKGLVLYLIWFAIPVLGLIGAGMPASSLTLLVCLVGPAVSIFAIYFYAALDAYRSARRANPHYKLQDYNRAGLYGLLILVQLVCPVALTAGMREFVFEAFYIPSRNMIPSILQGDRVLVNKLIARRRFPERGDLIVFRNPGSEGGTFIKRVVALPGDSVSIDGDHVEINGKRLQRERIPREALQEVGGQLAGNAFYEFNAGNRYKIQLGDSADTAPTKSSLALTVPQRCLFVLGDNRNRSRDSRHFGTVHIGDVIGYVAYIYFPAETWSRFGTYRDEQLP